MKETRQTPGVPTEEPPPAEPGAPPPAEALDLGIERIDTEGVMKEGFTGQEM